MHIPKVLGTAFFIQQLNPVAAFEVSFSIRKRIKKKKVNGGIAFALISLFHVQIQEPTTRSTTTRAFLFLAKFIVTQYLKQEVDDNFSGCVGNLDPEAFL